MKRTHKIMLLSALLTAGMATAIAAGPRSGGLGGGQFANGGPGRCLQPQAASQQVLTSQERLAMREEMRNTRSQAERDALRAEHRQLIQERLRDPSR